MLTLGFLPLRLCRPSRAPGRVTVARATVPSPGALLCEPSCRLLSALGDPSVGEQTHSYGRTFWREGQAVPVNPSRVLSQLQVDNQKKEHFGNNFGLW